MSVVSAYKKCFVAKSASSVFDYRLNSGGRVLLPYTVLEEISRLPMVYPLQFCITSNLRGKLRVIYAAVLEFNAEIGVVVLPDWMFNQLHLSKGSVVTVATCSLDAGSLIKLRPHEKAFTMLTDPRHALELHLVNYPILTKDSTIVIDHAQHTFKFDVVEVYNTRNEPVNAVLTARADAQMTELKVEFDRPLDMPPSPDTHALTSPNICSPNSGNVIGSSAESGVQFKPFVFKPPSIKSPTDDSSNINNSGERKIESDSTKDNDIESENTKPNFVAFTGVGKTLSATSQTKMLSAEEIRQKRLKALTKNQVKQEEDTDILLI